MNLIREGPKSSINCALGTVHASEGINQNETPVKGRGFCIKFEVCPCCLPSLRCFLTSKRLQAVASLVSHACKAFGLSLLHQGPLISGITFPVKTLLLTDLTLMMIQEFPVALNQRAELSKRGFVDLEMGKLLGSRQATPDPAKLTHVMSAGHCLTPRLFHSHCGRWPDSECRRQIL